jgi:MOSC domain-containing protein YiiM
MLCGRRHGSSAEDANQRGHVMTKHLSRDELEAGLDRIRQSPADGGTLEAIVIRPEGDARESLQRCEISPEGGVHGDNWADRRNHPDVQVTLMNARTIALVAQEKARWELAGDQLYVDLDLSTENLPPGTRLGLGSAILEITAEPHKGCAKFSERFGIEATRFVNSSEGRRLHLRGIYARVVQPGTVSVGDTVSKL